LRITNSINKTEKLSLACSINNSKNELDQLNATKAKGVAIRSCARWIENCEKNSTYFRIGKTE